MKRVLHIFGCLIAGCISLSAQHFSGFSAGGNFVHTLDKLPFTRSNTAGGAEIGLAYEWQSDYLLLRTGLLYSIQCPSMKVDSQWVTQEMIDTRGVRVTYRGLLDHRTDKLYMNQLTVPLMIGGTWKDLYLLAGLKATWTLASSAKETAALWTAGDYQGRYYEWLEYMPNHGYHDFEPVESRQSVVLRRWDLRLSAEVGYSFRLGAYAGRKPLPLMRIGLFAEYGLVSLISGSSDAPRTETDWSEYLHVQTNHVYASGESKDSRANLLLYGIRLTFLFPVSDSPTNHRCQCLPFSR